MAVAAALNAACSQETSQQATKAPTLTEGTVATTPARISTARRPTATPQFTASVSPVSDAQREAMLESGSWREGCPVAIDDLRVLSLQYRGFDGLPHQGQLMVNADVTQSVIEAFQSLFDARFPIHGMQLVDAFHGSDEESMQADNTSAFNCRGVPDSSAWSQHAYGRAIDVNPLENPEVRDGDVDPPAAARFADRSMNVMGMIHPQDTAVQAFSGIGWSWGGDWDSPKDYQHFSLTGD